MAPILYGLVIDGGMPKLPLHHVDDRCISMLELHGYLTKHDDHSVLLLFFGKLHA
jgi:hypothetical protein